MSTYSSASVGFVLLGGASLLGTVTTFQDSVEAITQETTVLGDSWAAFTSLGVKKGALSQSGFYNDATGSSHATLLDSLDSSHVFMYNLEGNTIGKHFVGYYGVLGAKYDRVLALEKLHMANATYSPSGPIEEGTVLKTHAAISAAGDTTASYVDNGIDTGSPVIPITSNSVAAASVVTCPVPHGLSNGQVVVISGVASSDPTINGERVITYIDALTFSVPVNVTTPGTGGTFTQGSTKNGGAAYLAVSALALGGYTNLDVRVQHSADHSTWADLSAFTVVTAAPAAERKVVSAATTVNRYLAAIWSFTGAGSGPSATFVVGFHRA